MKRTAVFLLIGFYVTALCVGGRSAPQNPLAGVAESHIKGNAPSQKNFDKFLKRDLTAYFTKASKNPVSIRYSFLRDGPTQTGVSYPKYYLWVKIFRRGKQIDEGAVRVAGVEKQRFEITHYLSRAEIRKHPAQIESVFPLPVCAKIRKHL